MESHTTSFVSKARIAIHSAAAKAERVLLDLKTDRDSDKQFHDELGRRQGDESARNEHESKFLNELKHIKWRPPHIGTKQDWQDRINNIRKGRKEVEVTDKVGNINMASAPFYDEHSYILNEQNDLIAKVEGLAAATEHPIPPSSVLKQLAIAFEAGKRTNSMKDFVASSRGSSPAKERAGLSLSSMKALVLREKEAKLTSEFSSDEKVLYLINSLFDPEGRFLRRKINSDPEETSISSLPRDIHGAPPESLVAKLAEVIGNFKTLQEMALFWCRVVAELRKHWSKEKYLPGVPQDDIPDLKYCLLYQKFQVINCCISRKRRYIIATESLNSMMVEANLNTLEPAKYADNIPAIPLLHARLRTGELVLRLGADCPSGDLMLLETGEPAFSPVTQEGPLLTEDLIKETEEFVLRTGSVGAGCSQLLSDMQAFKAANPGCILEDFVRWYSPPDWTESEGSTEDKDSSYCGESMSTKGQLSLRMQKEGNLWRELWETSKPVPAVKQAPLYDEDLAVEGILDAFEDIPPSELFEQLFVSLVVLGISEVISTENLPHKGIVKMYPMYEMVEKMMVNPDEAVKIVKMMEESSMSGSVPKRRMSTGEPKQRLKQLSHMFGGKDKASSKSVWKEEVTDEIKLVRHSFSSFFDNSKSSLFSKKPPKPGNLYLVESDWTVI
ncbi:Rab3 GTPase-activating protein catalytic subunit [Vigna unguiculata]|uniref:Rab3 GTPase-activating protein catalytic subunit n=2 Tax=Vigna unguiculata TaxID=3917 RepID=A0A4D6KP62_VIGUN|nr:Rab3 GTPase-activating protein catalytic subunit [Vigna unguiculata]